MESILTNSSLFRFLECMNGVKPRGILTDQCGSIESGIRHVFGQETVHRYCSWHILHKLPTKWGHVSTKVKEVRGSNSNEVQEVVSLDSDKVTNNNKAKIEKVKEKKAEKSDRVKEVVYKSRTKEEFEVKWIKLMDDLGKTNDAWFRGIFDLREKWVPVFLNSQFWAGMTSTQRVESMNNFLNSYLRRRESLKDFVDNFEAALKNIWQNENTADFQSKYKAPKLHYDLPMEEQFQRSFTNEIFYKCQQEFRKCVNLSCKLIEEKDGDAVYEVRDCRDKTFLVIYRRALLEIKCICSKFEAMGILCCHCIQVLKQERIYSVDDKYIVERWRKDIQRYNLTIVDPSLPTIPEQSRYLFPYYNYLLF